MNTCEQRQRVALIVDDIEDNRVLLQRSLQTVGYSTLSADSGAEALSVLASQPVDIVLLDWMMPGLSGLETLQAIRLTYSRSRLPVIMCTAVGEEDHVVRAIEAGANDYVVKPISLPILRARMVTHLSQSEEVLTLDQEKHDAKRRMADQIRSLMEMRSAR